jgi:LysR family glycine cleavage system transcriptional activator
VVSPKLLNRQHPIRRPGDLVHYPFIHAKWPDTERHAPTWQRWLAIARHANKGLALDMADEGLTFSEELHAIDAVIAGQGVGLFSDVLLERELASGELIKLLDLALPGLGFYLVYTADHPRQDAIRLFSQWIMGARGGRTVN